MGGFIGTDLVLSVPKNDGYIPIPINSGTGINSIWTPAYSTYLFTMSREGPIDDGVDYYIMPIITTYRGADSKGIKIKSVSVSYYIEDADDTKDQLYLYVTKQRSINSGVSPEVVLLAGGYDDDYDQNHNTLAKRLSEGYHVMTVSIPTSLRSYIRTGETYYCTLKIGDSEGSDLVFVLNGAYANADVLMF